MMWLKEAHQSFNLKENSRADSSCCSRQTKDRGRERTRRIVEPPSTLRDGEGVLEGGIKVLPHCGASFYKVHHITSAFTSIDISSSASHQSLPVMPAYSVSNKINAYALGV